MTLFCLHGFLGQPTDFQWCVRAVRESGLSVDSISPDYLHVKELSASVSLKKWGQHFNHWVEKEPSSHHRVLFGYSQGGRLALHALKDNPEMWTAAVIVSANPGIEKKERPARLKNDERWAQLFLTESFEWLLNEWNKQPVFAGSIQEPERFEKDYDRRILSECLYQWSAGHQEDFRKMLKEIQVPILWIVGSEDPKYVQMSREIEKLNPKIQVHVIEDSGHRVIFDQPQKLGRKIKDFLLPLEIK